MMKQVDKFNGRVVQKITRRNGKLVCYQSGLPGNERTMQPFTTLQEARAFIGIVPKAQKDAKQ